MIFEAFHFFSFCHFKAILILLSTYSFFYPFKIPGPYHSATVHYSSSLPRHFVRQPGFKYADAQEISNASLRPGCLQPQTLPPHHYANFRLQHHQLNPRGPGDQENNIQPDVIQHQQLQVTEAEEARADRHVIVNQLLTFLTEKQQQQQLIDLSEAASTTSTIKLTDTPN